MKGLPEKHRDLVVVAAACALMGLVLVAMTVGGTFTNDEAHYLATITALKGGTFRLESTAGLMPSKELLGFGAFNYFDVVHAAPAAPNAPPLYAFVALPFAALGFRALIALNTVAFLVTGALVFRFTANGATRASTAYGALAIYWLASFSLEYAIGMWPHALAVALCTGALVLVHRASERGSAALALAAGALIGVAAGIRYQDVVFGGLLAGVLAYWRASSPTLPANTSPVRRIVAGVRLVPAYAAGAGGPLFLSAYVNHARLGLWNPITKGSGYERLSVVDNASRSTLLDALHALAVRVVDFSLLPVANARPGVDPIRPDAVSGAILYDGVVKKALLQSAPWAALALVVLVLAWRGGRSDDPGAASVAAPRRELRGLSVLVLGTLAMFASAGTGRSEGYCYNMRYFLELMPLLAITTAWTVDRFGAAPRSLLIAALFGAAAAIGGLALGSGSTLGHLVVLRVPLAMALLVAVAAAFAWRSGRGAWLAPALGICVGWSVALHIGADVLGSLKVRARNEYYMSLAPELDARRTALVAYRAAGPLFAPLTLDHDLTMVDPSQDGGKTAGPLVDQLLEHGFRVLVVPQTMPPPILSAILDGHDQTSIQADNLTFIELAPKAE